MGGGRLWNAMNEGKKREGWGNKMERRMGVRRARLFRM